MEEKGFKIEIMTETDGVQDLMTENTIIICSGRIKDEVFLCNRTKWNPKVRLVMVFCLNVEAHSSCVQEHPNLVYSVFNDAELISVKLNEAFK